MPDCCFILISKGSTGGINRTRLKAREREREREMDGEAEWETPIVVESITYGPLRKLGEEKVPNLSAARTTLIFVRAGGLRCAG